MKALHLTIKKEFFDLIASGEKKEEYREYKDYWTKRLCEIPNAPIECRTFKKFGQVIFKNGYSSESPVLIVECLGISISESKAEWCGGVVDVFYTIKLGRIIYNSQK